MLWVVGTFFLVVQSAYASAPCNTLDNFEKDLQEMSKAAKSFSASEGSFVDKVASKRKHKEEIDQKLSGLKNEITLLEKEVNQLDSENKELEEQLSQESKNLEVRVVQVESVVNQLEQERSLLSPGTT